MREALTSQGRGSNLTQFKFTPLFLVAAPEGENSALLTGVSRPGQHSRRHGNL